MTGQYDLAGKGGTCAGLAMDAKNRILFATCRNPQVMVILNADGREDHHHAADRHGDTDGAVFNPNTMEAFSSQGDGTLTMVKENSPTSFEVEQTLTTMPGAKTLTLDRKTNRILLIAADVRSAASGDSAALKRTHSPRPHGGGFVLDSVRRQVVGPLEISFGSDRGVLRQSRRTSVTAECYSLAH